MTNFLDPPDTRSRYVAAAAQTQFQIGFEDEGVIKSPIVVRTLAVGGSTMALKTVDVDYTIDRDAGTVDFLVAPGAGVVVDIQRATERERNVVVTGSTTVTGAILNRDEEQSFRFKQELEEQLARRIGLTDREDEWNAQGKPICNVGSPPEGRLDCVLNYGDLLALFGEGLIAALGDAQIFFFEGDGTTTDFTLTGKRDSSADIWQVYKNGVRQYPRVQTGDSGVYTVINASGADDVLSFDTAPENGTAIAVMTYSGTVIATLLNNTIETQHIVDRAVTLPKLFGGVGAANRIILLDGNGDASAVVPVAAYISDFDTQVRTSRLDQMATPTAPVGMGSQRITDLPSPAADNDAARKSYVDNKRLDQFVAPTSAVQCGTQRLAKVAAPTESDDAANRAYVDGQSGVVIGTPVSVSTVELASVAGWQNTTGKPVLLLAQATAIVFNDGTSILSLEVKRDAGAWTEVSQSLLTLTTPGFGSDTSHTKRVTLVAAVAPNDLARVLTNHNPGAATVPYAVAQTLLA